MFLTSTGIELSFSFKPCLNQLQSIMQTQNPVIVTGRATGPSGLPDRQGIRRLGGAGLAAAGAGGGFYSAPRRAADGIRVRQDQLPAGRQPVRQVQSQGGTPAVPYYWLQMLVCSHTQPSTALPVRWIALLCCAAL